MTEHHAEVDAPQRAGLVTGALLCCDIVDSTKLIARLGDQRSSEVFTRHDAFARELTERFHGQELNRTDGFLLLFPRTIDAVGFALAYLGKLPDLANDLAVPLHARVGIHFGEVLLRNNEAAARDQGARPIQPEGLAVPMTSRIASLAEAGQILLTRTAFDLARRAVVGTDLFGTELSWLSHGLYRLKGVDEPLEVYEVGIRGSFPLTPPRNSEKATRALGPGEEETLGWRPAAGQLVPHRANWVLEEKIGEGGFGEVWLARNSRTRLARVFKFCFQSDRLRGLKREVSIFTLLREALGDRSDIAHILDYQFDEAPFFIETEYSKEGSLVTWSERRGGIEAIDMSVRLEIVAQIAEALGAAHSAGILHKDVKPSNILVLSDSTIPPRVALADFGIGIVADRSLLAAAGANGAMIPGSTVTYNESSRTGTRVYMAPELLEGRFPSTRSDIFSLGVLLFQMVTAQFGRALPSDWRDEVSDPLVREDIAACVAGRPSDRIAAAIELADRLRTLPERRRARARGRLVQFAAAFSAIAVLLLGGGVAAFRHESQLRHAAERSRREAEGARSAAEVAAASEAAARRQAEASVAREKVARATAEDVIRFMLFKMREKLRPLNKLDLLEEVATRSLAYFDEIPPEEQETTSSLRQRTAALDNIAEVLHSKRRLEDANAVYERVFAIRTDLAAREPENLLLQSDLAVTLLKLAEMQQGLGHLDEAATRFRDASARCQLILERDPANAFMRRIDAICRERIGLVLEGLGRFEDSIAAYEEAVPTFERELERSGRSARALIDLGRIHRLLADGHHRRLRLDRAVDHATRAIELQESAEGAAADDATLAVSLAHVLRARADALLALGRTAEARVDVERAQGIGEALAAADPQNKETRIHLVEGELQRARILWFEGRTSDALAQLESVESGLRGGDDDEPGSAVEVIAWLSKAQLDRAHLLMQGAGDAAACVKALDEFSTSLERFREASPARDAVDRFDRFARLLRAWAAKSLGEGEPAGGGLAGLIDECRQLYDDDPGGLYPATMLATALLAAGETEEARPVVDGLMASGYRPPDFVALCHAAGLEPQDQAPGEVPAVALGAPAAPAP